MTVATGATAAPVGRPGFADVDVRSDGCGLPEKAFESGDDAGVGPAVLTWERHFPRVLGEHPAAAEPASRRPSSTWRHCAWTAGVPACIRAPWATVCKPTAR